MFTELLDRLKMNVISILSRIQVKSQEEVEREQRLMAEAQQAVENEAQGGFVAGDHTDENDAVVSDEDFENLNISRNDPCPCGSGKKYKHCHGNKAKYA